MRRPHSIDSLLPHHRLDNASGNLRAGQPAGTGLLDNRSKLNMMVLAFRRKVHSIFHFTQICTGPEKMKKSPPRYRLSAQLVHHDWHRTRGRLPMHPADRHLDRSPTNDPVQPLLQGSVTRIIGRDAFRGCPFFLLSASATHAAAYPTLIVCFSHIHPLTPPP